MEDNIGGQPGWIAVTAGRQSPGRLLWRAGGACLRRQESPLHNINQRLADINGLPVKDHLGHTLAEIVPPDMYRAIEPSLQCTLEGN